MTNHSTTTEPTPPDRIWMRAEVLASPELREHFVKLNSNDIEYSRVSASVAPAVDEMGIDTNFPLSETLRLLVEWAQHLHVSHECDCDGWEQRSFLIEAAQRYRSEIAQPAPASTVAPQESDLYDADGYCRECASAGKEFYAGYVEQRRADHAKLHAPASPIDIRDEGDRPTAEPRYGERTCKHCGKPIKNTPRRPNRWTHIDTASLFCEPVSPSTRAKAAAEEIDKLLVPLREYSKTPGISEIAIIIERCFSTEGEDTKSL